MIDGQEGGKDGRQKRHADQHENGQRPEYKYGRARQQYRKFFVQHGAYDASSHNR